MRAQSFIKKPLAFHYISPSLSSFHRPRPTKKRTSNVGKHDIDAAIWILMRREHETVRAIRRLYTHVALHMLEDEAIHGESMAKTALVPVGKLDALVNPAKQVCRRERVQIS